jgi:hypothetical protein
MISFVTCSLLQLLLDDETEDDDLNRAYGKYAKKYKFIKVLVQNPGREDHLIDLRVDGRILLK